MKKSAAAHTISFNKIFHTDNKITFLSCMIVFMAQMATTIYLPSLPIVANFLHITRANAELSISLFVIGAASPVLFFGAAADRFGRRPALLFSLLLFIISGILLTQSKTLAELLILRFIQGIGAGGAAIVARIIVRDHWAGNDLAKKLSILSMAFITALGGGQFIGGLIAKYSTWQLGFYIMSVAGFLALIFSFSIPMNKQGKQSSIKIMAEKYFDIIASKEFLIPACTGGFGFAALTTLQQMSPFIFQKHFGLDAAAHGNIGLLIGVAYFCGSMTVNRMVSYVGVKTLILRGAFFLTISSALISILWFLNILSGFLGLIVFTILYCVTVFGQAVLFPVTMAAAVGNSKENGPYSMALCGFLQQSTAGIAAVLSTLFYKNSFWTVFLVLLCLTALKLAMVIKTNSDN